MRKLNVGVIGLGVGRQHALAYRSSGLVDDIYLCDFDQNKCRSVAKEINAAGTFNEWTDLFNIGLDAISICSFDNDHTEQMLAFASQDVNIMVEKPMCVNRNELEQIKQNENLSELVIHCNFIMREYPRFKKIKELLDSGLIGEIFYCEADYLHLIEHKITDGWRGEIKGYSTILGGGIHLIDQVLQIANSELTSITGMSNKIATNQSNFTGPDTHVNLLKFENNLIAKVVSTFSSRRPKFHNFKLFGTKGTIENQDDGVYLYQGDNPKFTQRFEIEYPGVGKGGKILDFLKNVEKQKNKEFYISDLNYLIKLHNICLLSIENS